MVKPVMGQQEVVVKATCVNRTVAFECCQRRRNLVYLLSNQVEVVGVVAAELALMET